MGAQGLVLGMRLLISEYVGSVCYKKDHKIDRSNARTPSCRNDRHGIMRCVNHVSKNKE